LVGSRMVAGLVCLAWRGAALGPHRAPSVWPLAVSWCCRSATPRAGCGRDARYLGGRPARTSWTAARKMKY